MLGSGKILTHIAKREKSVAVQAARVALHWPSRKEGDPTEPSRNKVLIMRRKSFGFSEERARVFGGMCDTTCVKRKLKYDSKDSSPKLSFTFWG